MFTKIAIIASAAVAAQALSIADVGKAPTMMKASTISN
jgi:hypothetical protein